MGRLTIRQARRLAEITQADMATRLGVCRDTYRKLEEHPEQSTVEQAIRIAELLGVQLCDLIFLPDNSTISRT